MGVTYLTDKEDYKMLTYNDFLRLWSGAQDCANVDEYLADEGGSVDDWQILPDIYAVATGGFRALHEVAGTSLRQMGRDYNIPIRSLENWSSGASEAPGYVIQLLAYAVLCGSPND